MQLSVSSSAAQLWICCSAVWPSELHAAHRQKDAEASSLCGFPPMEVDEFWFVPLPNAMCFKAFRKCSNTGLIVGPRKQLIMGEKDDEGRSIGVVHSNVQETFGLSSLKRLKRYSWTGYVWSVNRKNGERWKDLGLLSVLTCVISFKINDKLSFKDVLFCVGFTLQDIPGCCACDVDGRVEKLWNYFCFCWHHCVFPKYSRQPATFPAGNTVGKRHWWISWAETASPWSHVLLSPRGTQVQPPRGLETRMSHHRDDRFCRLMAFDPFSASRQANLSVHCWGERSGRGNKEDFYWEWCSWTAGAADTKCCERPRVISQRGLHVASRGWGHFLLGSSPIVNVFRKPERFVLFFKGWIFLIAFESE